MEQLFPSRESGSVPKGLITLFSKVATRSHLHGVENETSGPELTKSISLCSENSAEVALSEDAFLSMRQTNADMKSKIMATVDKLKILGSKEYNSGSEVEIVGFLETPSLEQEDEIVEGEIESDYLQQQLNKLIEEAERARKELRKCEKLNMKKDVEYELLKEKLNDYDTNSREKAICACKCSVF